MISNSLNLISGGLDSMLAARVLQEQGIEVTGICFESAFFNSDNAKKSAKMLGIDLLVEDISEEHLEIVKNPKYGYGKNMNPCIDCHGFMLKKAKEIAEKKGFNIIATGEVLGQRPMSQNFKSLKIVEKLSSLKDRILRPLSALVLDPTEYEKQGLVDRNKLFGIQGKGRKMQLELVSRFGFKNYSTPAGGCKLTMIEYSNKLKNLLEKHPDSKFDIIPLLSIGRHIWKEEILYIVTRNKEDAEKLYLFKKKDHLLIKMKDFPGPYVLVIFMKKDKIEDASNEAIKLIFKYKKIETKDIVFVKEYQEISNDFYFRSNEK